jgi:hypothetical protein
MDDKDKARFDAALDLIQWFDARIAHQVEQRLAQEREYWRVYVLDLIAAEREGLVTLLKEEHENIVELVGEKHAEVFDFVQRTVEQFKRHAQKGFDRLEAKLDEFVAPMRRRDDDGEPSPSTH